MDDRRPESTVQRRAGVRRAMERFIAEEIAPLCRTASTTDAPSRAPMLVGANVLQELVAQACSEECHDDTATLAIVTMLQEYDALHELYACLRCFDAQQRLVPAAHTAEAIVALEEKRPVLQEILDPSALAPLTKHLPPSAVPPLMYRVYDDKVLADIASGAWHWVAANGERTALMLIRSADALLTVAACTTADERMRRAAIERLVNTEGLTRLITMLEQQRAMSATPAAANCASRLIAAASVQRARNHRHA